MPTANTPTPPTPTNLIEPTGSTSTGLDALVALITDDPGLQRKVPLAEIYAGASAADAMNVMIVEAIRATGVANNGDLTAADLYDVNAWLRANRLDAFTIQHGDDEGSQETGFHLVQNDGATTKLFERNAVNTVADGIYHLAFEIRCGQFLNEDGDANAKLTQVANWLSGLLATDLAADTLDNAAVDAYVEGSTGTGLDRVVLAITTDEGLNRKISNADIRAGATAADAMNHLIVDAIRATGVANNGDISIADLRDMNAWLRENHLTEWTAWHGDDEEGEETGFHLVQDDGANGRLFERNAVDTVADGLYHLAFEICDNQLLNEDGNANASLRSVSTWLNGLLAADFAAGTLVNAAVDPYAEGTTGTGLDQLVRIITTDEGLNRKIATSEIHAGAMAADAMNALIVEAIRATGAADGGAIDVDEVRELNTYLRDNHRQAWVDLHGDDEDGQETGFHLVQNDGASTRLFERNAVNTIADGLYHLGFEIQRNRLVNEDGDANASLRSVADWLNGLLAEDLADGSLTTGTPGDGLLF